LASGLVGRRGMGNYIENTRKTNVTVFLIFMYFMYLSVMHSKLVL